MDLNDFPTHLFEHEVDRGMVECGLASLSIEFAVIGNSGRAVQLFACARLSNVDAHWLAEKSLAEIFEFRAPVFEAPHVKVTARGKVQAVRGALGDPNRVEGMKKRLVLFSSQRPHAVKDGFGGRHRVGDG